MKSVMLSTVSPTGEPDASYAPCVVDDARSVFLFASGLSAHTRNMQVTGKVSILFIEDEANIPEMYARKRLSYNCNVALVERGTPEWDEMAAKLLERFGEIVEVFKSLGDFRMFKLQPTSGRFIVGFGKAYKVDPNDLSKLVHTRGKDSESAGAGK